MSARNQFKLLLGGLSRRASLSSPHPSRHSMGEFLDRSRLVAALIFLVTVIAIVVISSAGLTTLDAPLRLNQVATTRVSAQTTFSYKSSEKTEAAREQRRNSIPPVYRLDHEPLRRFETAARLLLGRLAAFEQAHPGNPSPLLGLRPELTAIAEAFNTHGPYHATAEDIAAILLAGDAGVRAAVFDHGIATLRELHAQGIADSSLGGTQADGVIALHLTRPDTSATASPVQSMEDALTVLRVSLATDRMPLASSQAIFRLFRFGLSPNLVFDRTATQARQAGAASEIQPVTVNVARGQPIVEPGDRITPETLEMLSAHRQRLSEQGDAGMDEDLALVGRVLLVLAMVIASLIYIRIEDPETLRSNVRCGLLALVVIANLALVRANYSLGGIEFFLRDASWASTLPYVAPTAFAPLIVAILIDAGSGIFMALFISIFTGVIYGNLVRAAGMGGLTIAAFAALIGIADRTPVDILLRQMSAGLAIGLLTGIGVVGLLPVLEALFKRTTDITLLELTDYNHPLLRRMQLEAPGTYHHSLVVAQLSENAAGTIGANPVLARVCALFHDVGKTINPLHFSENQREQATPHLGLPPAESARIIRQHVPDGIELAHRHNLPRAVIDTIQQHHGTTLVRYFYEQALSPSKNPLPPDAEAPFRYEGPKPQSKETAIISLADGVEAASRSLRQADPAALRGIIDRIVGARLAEGQLDEAPLTLEEIARVKNSFQFSLLNMLHSRVAYPAAESPPGQTRRS